VTQKVGLARRKNRDKRAAPVNGPWSIVHGSGDAKPQANWLFQAPVFTT
jgi:hypothetical protein